jgi:FixJ family two-component response regulator
MATNVTVFVVDDDPGVLRSTRWLLESDGLSVETYSSAGDFLAAYDPDRPGCLVLDLRMPDMDGLELQQRLRPLGEHPPIIFVTGSADVPQSAQAMEAGGVAFLDKPTDDEQLLKLVRQALEQDQRRRHGDA